MLVTLIASAAAAWTSLPLSQQRSPPRSAAASLAWSPQRARLASSLSTQRVPLASLPLSPSPPQRAPLRRAVLCAQGADEPSGRGVVVLLTGFEQFNVGLYEAAAAGVGGILDVRCFTDRDIGGERLEAALAEADVFFASLVFDYDQVEWLSPRLERVRHRFVFESALELMSCTRVGTFTMAGGGGGPPAPVKALLSKFGSGKEEDRLAGYLNFLKVGPSLLRFVPGDKARDVRLWLEAYSYWNEGGTANVQTMLRLLARRLKLEPTLTPAGAAAGALDAGGAGGKAAADGELPPPIETPPLGLVHPDADGRYFGSLAEYEGWYATQPGKPPAGAPTVGLLLYRKHVISQLEYVGQLVHGLERCGLRPLPVFINGVEAHTVVRDAFTSERKEELLRHAPAASASASALGSARVDAVVNTIGFPLVGGPAGSMAAGRRVDVAAEILSQLDVPYVVAAPLLIQDDASWRRDGVQGLQQVVLYALPELDGAVDTVVLGGLDGDDIKLDLERVAKLGSRLNGWLKLRSTPPAQRRLSILVYGFPPNVGATGTAALLDVPSSLDALLARLRREGYDLGPHGEHARGETLVAALATITQDEATARGAAGLPSVLEAATHGDGRTAPRVDASDGGLGGATVAAAAVDGRTLRGWLGGELSERLEAQWGELEAYRGLACDQEGGLVCAGLQLGNVFLGVQPLLGVEGDPMRLLFERDLTPHPQYCAYYEWLWKRAADGGVGADAVVHMGMHGTVEWLPGSPLGGTALTWPDRLLGGAPNVYLYAMNNPSESILAKRRGYGTLVSYSVPPYARAGLYAELARTQQLIGEYRTCAGDAPLSAAALRPPIADTLAAAGLCADRPPPPELLAPAGLRAGSPLDGEAVLAAEAALEAAGDEAAHAAWVSTWDAWAADVYAYLSVLSERLFSEGLHQLGRRPDAEQAYRYLEAYFAVAPPEGEGGEDAGAAPPPAELQLPEPVLRAVAELEEGEGAAEAAARLAARPDGQRYAWAVEAASASVGTRLDALSGELIAEEAPPVELGEQLGSWLRDGLAWVQARVAEAAAGEGEGQGDDEGEAAAAGAGEGEAAAAALAADGGLDGVGEAPAGAASLLTQAVEIRQKLAQTDEELDAVAHALGGGYVRPAVGGDLIRDGAGVLPTGRNIHALDPFRVPSAAAAARGAQIAQKVLEAQRAAAADGAWPETVAVTLWGLNEIKTRGESVAVVLELVGARPLSEGTGRVVRYELLPLDELRPAGRPRVDVLASLSGIFRDSFANVVELLDDLFEEAAQADEPPERNYVRKHALELAGRGCERPAARLFSNPAGDYGSMVNERVGSGEWEEADELGETWASRNAFSYGRGAEKGQERADVLETLLASTERVVQMIDSVEYGLTDIQEYYANTGALKTAAEGARRRAGVGQGGGGGGGGGDGGRVGVSVVETFSRGAPEPRELEATLRMEYRSRLLNPKWAEAMAAQGSGGAYEISQRFTAMVGWGATAGFTDEWTYEGAYERYIGDEEMAATLTRSNPEAVRNMVRRLLEAHGRGMWEGASDEALARLRELYQEAEDVIELAAAAMACRPAFASLPP